jgi:peptide alpha-N-acetyltransferase
MHVKKAHLLKKRGMVKEASVVMEDARKLDLQDRYINNKSTKYLLRADMVNEAMQTIAMFTKDGGDPQQILICLQLQSA